MRGIDLNFIAPFRLHLFHRLHRLFQHDGIVDGAEADGYARGIEDGVRAHAEQVGRVGPRRRTQDQLEGIVFVDFEP